MTAEDAQHEGLTTPEPGEFRRLVLVPLARLRRRFRAYLLVEGIAVVFMVFLIAAGIQFAIDRTLRPATDMRALMLIAGLGAVFVAAWRRLVAPLRVPLSDDGLAVLLERHVPELHARLITAVELADAGMGPAEGSARSPELVRMVLSRVEAEAAGLPWDRPLNHRRVLHRGVAILLCFALTAATVRFANETVGLWFRRNVLLIDEPWPQRTRLLIEGLKGHKMLCARGDDFVISAVVLKGYEIPRQVFVEYRGDGGPSGYEQMLQIGRGRFQRVFERLGASMRCRVRGGDDRTDWFEVEVVDRPAIASIVIGVEPPKYTGAPAYELREGLTVAELLKGSRVQFHIIKTNKPVVSARLVRGTTALDGQVKRISDTEWVGFDRPEHSVDYHFELIDALGLSDHSDRVAPTPLSVRLMPDTPPKVKLQVRGVSDLVTPEGILPVQVDCSDTYGLAAVQLVQESTRATNAPRAVPIEGFTAGSKTFTHSFNWPLAPLALMPSDRLSLYAQARDFDDVSGPNIGKSSILSLRVVSREELLNELTRREQQCRQEFEQIVRSQEDLYAELLSVLASIGSGAAGEEHRHAFARIERRQRQQSSRTDAVRRRLEQILAEMEVNQALTPGTRERLGVRVVEPMNELVRTEMTEILGQLGQLVREDSSEVRGRLQPEQDRLLGAMRAVLANMLKYEGFQEAVSLLRDILNLQNSVNEETAKHATEEIEKVFGPEKNN